MIQRGFRDVVVRSLSLRAVVVCALIVSAAGCRAEGTASPAGSSGVSGKSAPRQMVRTELFFGSRSADAVDVTDWQWRTFVNDEITPRFPQGLTILSGDGQWRSGSSDIVHEHSWLVIILHDRSAEADRKIEQIRQLYKDRFKQESVLRADSTESVSF